MWLHPARRSHPYSPGACLLCEPEARNCTADGLHLLTRAAFTHYAATRGTL
jgi:hypothetical protein